MLERVDLVRSSLSFIQIFSSRAQTDACGTKREFSWHGQICKTLSRYSFRCATVTRSALALLDSFAAERVGLPLKFCSKLGRPYALFLRRDKTLAQTDVEPMNTIATAAKRVRTWLASHRVELGLCLRVAISAVLTFVAAQLIHLAIPLWAVLTAVILTQLNVGRSVKASIDYFIATVGAAIYAGLIGTLVPQADEISLLAALAIAVGPAALLAALNPRFSAAPFTVVLVLLAPTITHAAPFASAFERVMEVAVGGIIGLLVSILVFPARAQDLAIETAAHILELMARLLPAVCAKLTRPVDDSMLRSMQDTITAAFMRLETIALEARHERLTRLTPEPDQGPLLRTILRLRHDLIMIARAALVPLPESFQAPLGPLLVGGAEAAAQYLRACASALRARQGPPPLDAVSAALDDYDREMAALRQKGATRELPADAVEHIFTLNFALDQLGAHFKDLARCVSEFARPDIQSIANIGAPLQL